MSEYQVRVWATHHGITLTDEEVKDIASDSSLDPTEGVEWLPFYKAALGQLAGCTGGLFGMLQRIGITDDAREAVWELKRMFELNLLLCGIGANSNIEDSVKSRAKVEYELITCFHMRGKS